MMFKAQFTFTDEQIAKAAAVVIDDDDNGNVQTLLDYLKLLLSTLWREAEGFSGKRPFGSGAWMYDVYKALIRAELVKGKVSDGCVEDVDTYQADALVQAVITRLVIK